MSRLRSYPLYICRCPSAEREYAQLTALLSQARNFYFTDCAPADPGDAQALEAALNAACCVLVLWESCADCCLAPVKRAAELKKPIIVLRPLGNAQLPETLDRYATRVVGWSPEQFVGAVRFYGA